ncbi:MAG: hypothetical protein LBU53_07465 [Zoogloeaceae bacterium]|jgi:hypothetical protein|nr:hypothetical protein [Zoogloeaceae bacterium]
MTMRQKVKIYFLPDYSAIKSRRSLNLMGVNPHPMIPGFAWNHRLTGAAQSRFLLCAE